MGECQEHVLCGACQLCGCHDVEEEAVRRLMLQAHGIRPQHSTNGAMSCILHTIPKHSVSSCANNSYMPGAGHAARLDIAEEAVRLQRHHLLGPWPLAGKAGAQLGPSPSCMHAIK